MNGLLNHLLLTLRLNLRSKQALVYGYIVPVFFLIAFGSLFKTTPPLLHELGQLLTISVLGGACFGMPTSMVSERERGVWRRYRLLPAATGGLVFSTMVARFLIVASAAVLQIAMAIWIYGMPAPLHPLELVIAFTFVCFAFLGLGLIIAMLAETVPAVQALGQAIFLPMIIIGGVGVPLRILPAWAQTVAGFLPGRYAVDALQACVNRDLHGAHGLGDVGFPLLALTVIGIAACMTGSKLFRWDMGQRARSRSWGWVSAALASWVAVGVADWSLFGRGRASTADSRPNPMLTAILSPTTAPTAVTEPVRTTRPASAPASKPAGGYEAVTDDQINSVTYDDLENDNGDVTPIAASLDDLDDDRKKRLEDLANKLADWAPAKVQDPVQRTRNLISLAATADVLQDPIESVLPIIIFQTLKSEFPKEQLIKMLTFIILHPEQGTMVTTAPELGFDGGGVEDEVRARTLAYSKKLLGRLIGKILEAKPPDQ